MEIVVISASGYSCCFASVVRSVIASCHIPCRSAWLSKSAVAGGIYFWRTSPVTASLLAFGMISCASRRHDESPEGTGIRWTGLFAFTVLAVSLTKSDIKREVGYHLRPQSEALVIKNVNLCWLLQPIPDLCIVGCQGL